MAAGTELLGVIMDGIRENRIASKINEISAPMALSAQMCVIESLSNQWCAADDATKILKVKIDALVSKEKNPLLHAVRILETDLPLFVDWLDKVRNTVEVTDSAIYR